MAKLTWQGGAPVVSDGSSTSSIDSGDTLTINGTANEIDVAVSGDSVTLSIPDDVTLVNPTVSGTLTSHDITSSSVSVTGDAIITGNLTVQGTTTTVESTTVDISDHTNCNIGDYCEIFSPESSINNITIPNDLISYDLMIRIKSRVKKTYHN